MPTPALDTEIHRRIFELRRQGLSISKTIETLEKQGIKVCFGTVQKHGKRPPIITPDRISHRDKKRGETHWREWVPAMKTMQVLKLRGVLEVSDNLLPPEQQTEFLESWFNEIWHKVAFATWDNHAVERQEKQAGESSVKKLLSKKVPYFNGIGHVTLKVGNQTYNGCVSHTFRGKSMLNPIHSMMRYMRFEGHDREWAMAGDTHVPGMGKWTDGAMVRVAVNAGSLQLNSGFAKRYFSLTTHPVYPILVFYPDRHEVTPFWSIREFLEIQNK